MEAAPASGMDTLAFCLTYRVLYMVLLRSGNRFGDFDQ
jgi:hypothetical protein